MKINELSDGMRNIDIEGTITDIPEPRSVTLRTGKKAKVADCTLQDETDSIKLSLWNDDIDKVEIDKKIKIENGYTSSFQGEVKLNVGKFGRLIVLE